MLSRSSFHYALIYSFLDIGQTHLIHLPRCLLATASPKVFETSFAFFHWSPGFMAIYKLLFPNHHFRKHVTSHMTVMS